MERPSRSACARLFILSALLGGGLGFVSPGAADEPVSARQQENAQTAIPGADLSGFSLDDIGPRPPLDPSRVGTTLTDGRIAELTVDPSLQAHIADQFSRYDVPYGSVVAIEPSTGRVLAYVSHSSANPAAGDLALDPTPPTASVFKVITGAALIDAGLTPDERVCYHGGFSRLSEADLEDDADRDRLCATLDEAMGGSINSVFAKLADRNLNPERLTTYAQRFGFGEAIPFELPTRPSPMDVPGERLEFARTAAGFWHMHMSPLHGAMIASAIANQGRMPRPTLVRRIVDSDGASLYEHTPSVWRESVSAETARVTGEMMRRTVTHGTARRAFHDPRGRPFLPGIEVAGKTGTLSAQTPYRGYTWWVGFAPADNPTIAVAALVVNTPRWRIKASYMARETLRAYLVR